MRLCAPYPARPDVWRDDNELFGWVDRALEIGAECRDAHAKLSDWVLHPPK